MGIVLYSVHLIHSIHCTLYDVHYIYYNIPSEQWTVYAVRRTLYTRRTVYILQYTQRIVYDVSCTTYIIYTTIYPANSERCTANDVHYIYYNNPSEQWTVYAVRRTLYTVRRTVYIQQYTHQTVNGVRRTSIPIDHIRIDRKDSAMQSFFFEISHR